MGPETNRFHHHHHHHQNHNHVHQRNAIFLPMLCSRPAIKDVHGLPRCVDRSSSSSSEPLSPRISCIGQVKRKNRVLGFPNRSLTTTTTTTTTNNNNNHQIVKYSKLKKFFSSKNLTSSPKTTTPFAAAAVRYGCRRRAAAAVNGANGCCSGSGSRGVCNSEKCVVSVVDLDPPLPVVKRPNPAQEGGEVVESLWKRRSGGVALKGLQLQQIHHPRHHHLDQPTTV